MAQKKAAISVEVSQIIINQGMVHTSLVLKEVDWFFNRMGIDDTYLVTTHASDIAKHISSIYAGKILAKNQEIRHEFNLSQEEHDRAFFICRSQLGSEKSNCALLEQRLDSEYLLEGYSGISSAAKVKTPFRLKVFRSTGSIVEDLDIQLRFYLAHAPDFVTTEGVEKISDVNLLGDREFLKRASANTKSIYQELMNKVLDTGNAAIHVSQRNLDFKDERRLVVAYRHGTAHSLFSSITDLYHYHKFYSTKKFVEQFANGVTIMSAYLRPNLLRMGSEASEADVERIFSSIVSDLNTLVMIPRNSLTPLYQDGVLNPKQTVFGYVCWKFAHQFLSKYQKEYVSILRSVQKFDPTQIGHLLKLKKNLRKDMFTEDRVFETISQYPELVKMLYSDFDERFNPANSTRQEFQKKAGSEETKDPDMGKIEAWINRNVKSEFDILILAAMVNFNKHILKTNFFKSRSAALSFRLDPRFLSTDEYPVIPFGVFFVVGSEFRGFHVRFEDVARGGIRIIRSANGQTYAQNVGTVFDENYNLANTQQRKNKDIPEGGSKGTIFLHLNHQEKGLVAFKKYIDSLVDLLLPHPEVIDYYGKDEILFLGPDEGTAEYMDWASQHARKRGAHFWKAFTTGKSTSLGGIPHDMFGMTTRSIHQYVLGVLEKLGLDEKNITKFQTGGPDGDLGSNEIKISFDKTTSIVDGSGVIYDPKGLDRTELTRLANKRQMVRFFDKSKLSKDGFFVDVDDREITLPDGEIVPNGMVFRNNFHLNKKSSADLFVPCGGRPEAVNANNFDSILDENGNPRFKVICEGANLFFTQEARLELEKRGVIVYKDAAANKGGVTSSSLEVLSALALTDEEFHEHMQVHEGKQMPEFYKQYVQEVQGIIEKNARLEFECIWNEHMRTKEPRCIISDTISIRINELNSALRKSSLWDNVDLRKKVIANACPKILVQKFGIDTILARVPESYLQAIFGANLASTFIYKYGLKTSEFAFFDFMDKYMKM
jgi:glutamate dehydrogenase